MSTKWCCPPTAISTCHPSGVAPPAAPSTCWLSGIALQLLCPPVHSPPRRHPGPAVLPLHPETASDGARSAAQAQETCQGLREAEGLVAGGGVTQRPSCSRRWGAWGNWGAAAQPPVLKAGSALPFSQMSYSQSLYFTKRERPCHRQMCWWGFQISIRYWIFSKDVRKCKVHLKTSVSISVDYFIMVCFHCGSKRSATLHGSFLCCQEQGNISFSFTFQVLHWISEGEHSIKSQSDLTIHKEVTSIIITKS